ncbi:MAG: ABC transporter substrate-binding protein [Planctomycetales bacterium]|nr:ABC transporter substrate-binding protein [Planctomycetales bacterium]
MIRRSIAVFWMLAVVFGGCKPGKPSAGREEMVLNQRLEANIQTLDPADVGDTSSDGVCREFCESLYAYDYLKRPHQVVPELAAAMPDISEDGRIYRIGVKQGVYFHDDPCFAGGKGRQLTAHDFVYAFKRLANVRVQSKNWYIFDGRVVGLDDFRNYTKTCEKDKVDYSRPVEGLYAEDDFTLVIKLHRPWPQLIFWLAFLPTAPMAREAVDYYGPDIILHPVGTGPFVLKQWHRGVYLEAVRNPAYREVYYPSEGAPGDAEAGLLRDAGRRLPFIDRVFWRVVVEDQPRWLLLMRGDIDINSIPKDNFGQAVSVVNDLTDEMKRRGMKMQLFDEPSTFWLGMNMSDPVLGSNKPLRYAINYAIDRQRFIEIIQSGKGRLAYGFVPPAMTSYDEGLKDWSPSRFDLQKARAYLKEAEKIHGGPIPKLRLAIGRTGTAQKQTLQFLSRCLTEIGLQIETELYDWPAFLEKLRTSDNQLYFSGWMADYPDAESFLGTFYGPNAPWPNSSNFHNSEFDAVYEQVSVMPDSPRRTELYRKAERIVIEEMPCAFVYHRVGYIIYHDWLDNLKADPYKAEAIGYGQLRYYKVNTQKRTNYRNNVEMKN